MEIDPTPVPPPQEYCDNPSVPYQSESSMNFDYLHGLHGDTAMDASNSGSSSSAHVESPRHFAGIGNSSSNNYGGGHVDYSKAIDRWLLFNFRKDALGLQEKRDFLLMSIDL
ncbi:uncharacterized protein LOC133330812 [Musca vetustissima]|uniref:uncharacterized protein LOC133330812 n=1 Tax=Musca vetustissima TaxID=27455 RepID=UPI002AB7AB8A|nr:uncharacterized protein LOC133330812 [Musca vetustissima]